MESRSLLERISARIEGTRPGGKPHAGRPVRDILSPEYDGEDSPGLPPCSQQLVLSDSEGEEPKKHLGYRSSKHFTFPQEKARSSVNVSDSSDEDFENFLVQLKTPKHAPTKPPGSSLKGFIVDSEDDDDFDSMFSNGGKGIQSGIGKKTSVTVSLSPVKAAVSSTWKDSPVFISDSDEDSIVIKSTWSNRHKTNPDPKDKGQRAKSVQKNAKENLLRPSNDQSSGRPAGTERSKVAAPKLCTPVSSDDEFESLMDRIKNRTKNQTPGSTARKENPKSALTEPVKGPCLDLTNKKKTEPKQRPQSYSDASTSPYFPPDKPVTKPRDDEESHPGKTGFPCKVEGCFLNDLSHPTSQYVKDFKQKKHGLATRLYSLYNRTIFDEKLPDNLEILWNKKMRKTAGYCVTGQKKLPTLQRYARIELSEKVCDSADRLRDTLIHEICHAATWLINGVRDGHGQYWRFYARKATLVHPELPMVTRCHTYEINYKFTYECSRCKNTIGRHSKSLDTERFVCALCKGKLVLQTGTRKDGSPATTQLTPFAKFVKENYGSTKKELTGMSHAEVMRKLSADFSSKTKISA